MNDVFNKAQGDVNLIPLLTMSADQLSAIAEDDTIPYYIRKIVEMLSSDNPSTSLSAIKFIREEEKKIKQPTPSDYGLMAIPLNRLLKIVPDDLHYKFTIDYHKTIVDVEYELDLKLLELFNTSGDLSYLEKFERRKRMRDSED